MARVLDALKMQIIIRVIGWVAQIYISTTSHVNLFHFGYIFKQKIVANFWFVSFNVINKLEINDGNRIKNFKV